MAEVIIYIIDIIILAFLGVQLVSVILFLITEWAMVDYYRFGTFENPTNNFQKIINFGMAFLWVQVIFYIENLRNIIGLQENFIC